MKSFVITLKDFFKLNQSTRNSGNFDEKKRSLVIPLYQREYKWNDENILALLNDIKKSSKFLGNIILEETDSHYEIVDGQQRITTLLLMLSSLYNGYSDSPIEQSDIIQYIKPYKNEVILRNDSVNEYLSFNMNKVFVSIKDDEDVFNQKMCFNNALTIISSEMKGWSKEVLHEFKEKLLNCRVLVLINDNDDRVTPVEQLFLDINEKAKQLEVEDVFKGHCFEKFSSCQNLIKDKWISLKEESMRFSIYNFKDVSQFLYLYILLTRDNSIPKNLTIKGKHFLDDKTMDETNELINEMISFASSVNTFFENIQKEIYNFEDICSDFKSHKNQNDSEILKIMSQDMLKSSASAIYQKLPFMYFVSALKNSEQLKNSIKFNEFRKILANLYIYTVLFIVSGEKKSKKLLDNTIVNGLNEDNAVQKCVEIAKRLRTEKVNEFDFPEKFDKLKSFAIYSIMDHYISKDNILSEIYTVNRGYNHEHFIVNQNLKVEWKSDSLNYKFRINEKFKAYKESSLNGLIIDSDLNEIMCSADIVKKIETIKHWYASPGRVMPKHIGIFIEYIEQMDEYKELLKLKNIASTKEEIERLYNAFLESYLDEENRLINVLESEFKNTFTN